MLFEKSMEWFKQDLKDGKCSDDCPACNAFEDAVKAFEKLNKYKWHNLEKNPNDLPHPNSQVIVVAFDDDFEDQWVAMYLEDEEDNMYGFYLNDGGVIEEKLYGISGWKYREPFKE